MGFRDTFAAYCIYGVMSMRALGWRHRLPGAAKLADTPHELGGNHLGGTESDSGGPDRYDRRAASRGLTGDQLTLTAHGGDDEDEDDARPPARKRWAWPLAHVFRADLDTCPRCGGPMRWLEAALGSPAIARLLAEVGLGTGPPTPVHQAVPAQLKLPFAR